MGVGAGAAVALGASAIGTIGSGVMSSIGAGEASKAQQEAALKAEGFLNDLWGQAKGFAQPFVNFGTGAGNQLMALTGSGPGGDPMTAPLTRPFQPTMDQLKATPGYQFALTQGLQATQNGLAARGLGRSGEALAGAANYATGLASTTYNQQFQNDLQSRQLMYNMLSGIMGVGAQSAQGLVQGANQTGGALAGQAMNFGNAQAAGDIAQANALGGIMKGLGSSVSNLYLMGMQNPDIGSQLPGMRSGYSQGLPLNFNTPGLSWNPLNPVGTSTLGPGTTNPFNQNY